MKPIAAIPGDRVCNSMIYGLAINGVWRAKTKAFDQDGHALPLWYACRRLGAQELFYAVGPCAEQL